ncbi:hypothetical protein A2U01_0098817, partial [Trifolium medium]|nr:hypothetical protein [Trifolium medium]
MCSAVLEALGTYHLSFCPHLCEMVLEQAGCLYLVVSDGQRLLPGLPRT